MPTRLSEVYDALKEAGASDEKSRKAAEAVANYDNQFTAIRTEMTDLKGSVRLVQWMIGFNLVISVGLLWKVLAQ